MLRARMLCALGGWLLVLGVSAACGGTAPVVDTQDETTSTATPEPTTPEPTTPEPTTADPTTPDETAEPVAYVPWGPDDPVIPQHYGELAKRDCTAAASSSPGGEFWDAVVAVCRTLAEGEPWPELSEAPPTPATDSRHDECLNAELAEMLSAALTWHAEHPDETPEVTYAETGSSCYLRVYDARQLTADEDFTDPEPGHVTVAVVLDSTYDLTSVTVDGSQLDNDDYSDSDNDPEANVRTVSVHLPAPESATEVSIELAVDEDGADRGVATTTVELSPVTGETDSTEDGDDTGESSDQTGQP